MKHQKAARRYAKTLFKLSRQGASLEKVLRDMKFISSLFERTAGLEAFFMNPLAKDRDIGKVLSGFSKHLCPLTKTFIKLLVKKKRLYLLKYIPMVFSGLFEEYQNIVRVAVYSAQKLSGDQMEKIKRKLRSKYEARDFIMENLVEQSLIAGLQIRIGDTVIDSNLKSMLHQLKRKLAA